MRGLAVVIQVLLAVVVFVEAGAPDGPEKVYNDAGYIAVHGGKHQLFYWFFESRGDPEKDPFVLWLSGGPGCSSQLAMFGENGPYTIQEDLSLNLNPYSWNNNATVLWLDQPVGTGFSYGGSYVVNETQIANDVYEFFQLFFQKHSKYSKLDFFVVGESYAGHYVPVISKKIVSSIGDMTGGEATFPRTYKGSAIGNGLTDPLLQFKYYERYAEMHNLLQPSKLLFMRIMTPVCSAMIKACNAGSRENRRDNCLIAYSVCTFGEVMTVKLTNTNLYDVREKCKPELPLCYNFTLIGSYLNQPSVKNALGTTGHTWSTCNALVDMRLVYSGDWMLDFSHQVAEVLDSGYRFLIYAGEYDYICNWMGNKAWVDQLEWSGHVEFQKAAMKSWMYKGKEAGIGKTFGHLTFLKVRNAGHMVPRDQPAPSLDMLNRFLRDEPLHAEGTTFQMGHELEVE